MIKNVHCNQFNFDFISREFDVNLYIFKFFYMMFDLKFDNRIRHIIDRKFVFIQIFIIYRFKIKHNNNKTFHEFKSQINRKKIFNFLLNFHIFFFHEFSIRR